MEKLIELFRDYVENYGNDTKDPTKDYAVIYDGQGFYVGARFYSDEKVLSKQFGFIKWLVENDKIDFDKVMKLGIPCFVRYDKGEIISVHVVDSYKQLIMILSIQDNPIEFLISILK